MIYSNSKKSLLVLTTGHFFVDLFLGVWPIYKTLAGLDLKLASLIAGTCLIIGEAGQVLFGFLGTKIPSKLLIAGGVAMTAGIGLLSYTSSYFLLFLIMLFLSLGSSAFHPTAAGLIGSWSEKSKGAFITLFFTGGTLGAAFSQMAFSAAWHLLKAETLVFAFFAIVAFIWIVFHRFPSELKSKGFSKAYKKGRLKELFLKKGVLGPLFFIQVAVQLVIVALMFLLPDLLQERGYPSWMVYGGGDFIFVMGSAVFGCIAGILVERIAFSTILLLSSLGSFLLLSFFLLSPFSSVELTAVLLFFIGGMLGMAPPLVLAKSQSLAAPELRSVISGLFLGGAACFAGIGIVFSGVMTTFFVEEALAKSLMILGCFLLIISGCVFRLKSL